MTYTKGFIALTAVLVLSAIFLSLSVSIATRTIAGSETSTVFLKRDKARAVTEACVEFALMELVRTLDYGGDESILIDDVTCTILPIVGTGNIDREIHAVSEIDSQTYRTKVHIDRISPLMEISSYERVVQF